MSGFGVQLCRLQPYIRRLVAQIGEGGIYLEFGQTVSDFFGGFSIHKFIVDGIADKFSVCFHFHFFEDPCSISAYGLVAKRE